MGYAHGKKLSFWHSHRSLNCDSAASMVCGAVRWVTSRAAADQLPTHGQLHPYYRTRPTVDHWLLTNHKFIYAISTPLCYLRLLCGFNNVWWKHNAEKAYLIKCSGSTFMLLSFSKYHWYNIRWIPQRVYRATPRRLSCLVEVNPTHSQSRYQATSESRTWKDVFMSKGRSNAN